MNARNIHFFKIQENRFFERNKFYGFKKIDEERKKEIENLASLWNSENKNLNPKEKIYQIYYFLNTITSQANGNIKLHDESYLFLLLAFDPKLLLLQIYFEEALISEIGKRFQEEFGFKLNPKFLQLEKYYNLRFPTIIDEFNHPFSK